MVGVQQQHQVCPTLEVVPQSPTLCYNWSPPLCRQQHQIKSHPGPDLVLLPYPHPLCGIWRWNHGISRRTLLVHQRSCGQAYERDDSSEHFSSNWWNSSGHTHWTRCTRTQLKTSERRAKSFHSFLKIEQKAYSSGEALGGCGWPQIRIPHRQPRSQCAPDVSENLKLFSWELLNFHQTIPDKQLSLQTPTDTKLCLKHVRLARRQKRPIKLTGFSGYLGQRSVL